MANVDLENFKSLIQPADSTASDWQATLRMKSPRTSHMGVRTGTMRAARRRMKPLSQSKPFRSFNIPVACV